VHFSLLRTREHLRGVLDATYANDCRRMVSSDGSVDVSGVGLGDGSGSVHSGPVRNYANPDRIMRSGVGSRDRRAAATLLARQSACHTPGMHAKPLLRCGGHGRQPPVSAHARARVCVCVLERVYLPVHVFVFVYLHIYIYIYIANVCVHMHACELSEDLPFTALARLPIAGFWIFESSALSSGGHIANVSHRCRCCFSPFIMFSSFALIFPDGWKSCCVLKRCVALTLCGVALYPPLFMQSLASPLFATTLMVAGLRSGSRRAVWRSLTRAWACCGGVYLPTKVKLHM